MGKYKGFLIDLDGTVYKGSKPIKEAIEFIKHLDKNALPYLFITNNSSKTPAQVADHLRKMGLNVTEDHVFTTSLATANVIKEINPKAKVYMIGEIGLKEALLSRGIEIVQDDGDIVVIGIDREITYEKFAKACLLIRNGAQFISTNADVAIPTERGLLPGNGALTAVIATSTGVSPLFIGKPERPIIEQALKILGTNEKETLLIGDNYDTDIMAGIHAGMDTLLVYTGVTTEAQLKLKEVKPTYTVRTLADWDAK